MDEALKTRQKRGDDFYLKYLSGKLIDIGAGKDLVSSGAERFDVEDGDANFITRYREPEAYDAVHSSHCLEHMFNPLNALEEWWSLVKPGGYLILVVPDEELYEQGIWPSMFNDDHKNTFRLDSKESWSPVSFNILDLVSSLPNAKIISAELHDDLYDYSLMSTYPPKYVRLPAAIIFIKKLIRRFPFGKKLLIGLEDFLFKYKDYPLDQTMRDALAQIQIVVMKNKI